MQSALVVGPGPGIEFRRAAAPTETHHARLDRQSEEAQDAVNEIHDLDRRPRADLVREVLVIMNPERLPEYDRQRAAVRPARAIVDELLNSLMKGAETS